MRASRLLSSLETGATNMVGAIFIDRREENLALAAGKPASVIGSESAAVLA